METLLQSGISSHISRQNHNIARSVGRVLDVHTWTGAQGHGSKYLLSTDVLVIVTVKAHNKHLH